MKLWLDDIRPAPEGWTHARTVAEAKALLETGEVTHASLDHDLGACSNCMNGRSVEDWLRASEGDSMPHCVHVGTGYNLCLWMYETGNWPERTPVVHSMNPCGRDRMNHFINRFYGKRAS